MMQAQITIVELIRISECTHPKESADGMQLAWRSKLHVYDFCDFLSTHNIKNLPTHSGQSPKASDVRRANASILGFNLCIEIPSGGSGQSTEPGWRLPVGTTA